MKAFLIGTYVAAIFTFVSLISLRAEEHFFDENDPNPTIELTQELVDQTFDGEYNVEDLEPVVLTIADKKYNFLVDPKLLIGISSSDDLVRLIPSRELQEFLNDVTEGLPRFHRDGIVYAGIIKKIIDLGVRIFRRATPARRAVTTGSSLLPPCLASLARSYADDVERCLSSHSNDTAALCACAGRVQQERVNQARACKGTTQAMINTLFAITVIGCI